LKIKQTVWPSITSSNSPTNQTAQEKISNYLNPDKIEGPHTRLLSNLEALMCFGFSRDELKEMILITLGHTTLGRIISGKMSERSLKPVSDMACTLDPQQAINMLRYCRLMTMAETSAAGGHELSKNSSPSSLSSMNPPFEW
jgi:hypothetical protein